MKNIYTIQDVATNKYLVQIYVGRCKRIPALQWTKSEYRALHFRDQDEALDTIEYIGNVVDRNLLKRLVIR